eukprot:5424165-Pyramimonas_sp.AAC.1
MGRPLGQQRADIPAQAQGPPSAHRSRSAWQLALHQGGDFANSRCGCGAGPPRPQLSLIHI